MRVHSPTTLAEACAVMARGGSARAESGDLSLTREALLPIAGGTDLLVHWPGNLGARERTYVDLSGVSELRGMRWTKTHLELGALATYWDVVRDGEVLKELPLLVMAARTVGAIQIQTRGTWAGNIVNASPAADGVPALMALDASVVLVSAGADGALVREEVRLDEFYLGYKKMRKRGEQLVEGVRVPRGTRRVSLFEKVGARRAQAITKVGVAITHAEDRGWRVVANSVGPTVRRCRGLEGALDRGETMRSPADVEALLAGDVSPIDDIRSTAEYRRRVLGRVVYFALRGVAAGVR